MLHLAEDQSQHQVQVLAELVPDLGDHYGDQSPHKGGSVLRGFRVQEFGYHLHDVVQSVVAWGGKTMTYVTYNTCTCAFTCKGMICTTDAKALTANYVLYMHNHIEIKSFAESLLELDLKL